jgi:SAM-dependent methyltransferase
MISSLKKALSGLLQTKTRVLRRWGSSSGNDWEKGLSDEVKFWAGALRDEGAKWNPAEYRERMNPDLPLQDYLRELIDAPAGATVRILDVGAGPLTRVGRKWEGRTIEITPIDPLAGEYAKIFTELALHPPVETIDGHGEKLGEQFADGFFDLAYASNALDHAYDPIAAIRQMVATVKPGSSVYLWHFANAGLHENFQGLHGWDFTERRGDMIVSDGRSSRSLRDELADLAESSAHEESAFGGCVVVARLRKKA